VITLQDGEVISTGKPQDALAGHVTKSEPETFSDDSCGQPPATGQPLATSSKRAAKNLDQRRKRSELSTYTYYFANSGWYLLLGNVVSVALWMFLTEFSSKTACSIIADGY
jgi:hypothetical protein